MIPIMREAKPNSVKSPIIWNGVLAVISLFLAVYFITVLNKMIETASLIIPSPKTILNSVGYLSYDMSDIAAMTSLEHKRLHMSMHSGEVSSSGLHSPVAPSYWVIKPSLVR